MTLAGLRPGEKLFEEKLMAEEGLKKTKNKLIHISMVLIINFVKLYTQSITDINYIDFIAALIFSFNLMLECSRGASLASANIAGKAPDTTWRYILEAAINLVSSLILVNFIGMKPFLLDMQMDMREVFLIRDGY